MGYRLHYMKSTRIRDLPKEMITSIAAFLIDTNPHSFWNYGLLSKQFLIGVTSAMKAHLPCRKSTFSDPNIVSNILEMKNPDYRVNLSWNFAYHEIRKQMIQSILSSQDISDAVSDLGLFLGDHEIVNKLENIVLITTKCRQIKWFRVEDIRRESWSTWMKRIGQTCYNLRYLKLDLSCSCSIRFPCIDSKQIKEGLNLLVEGCKKLKNLDFVVGYYYNGNIHKLLDKRVSPYTYHSDITERSTCYPCNKIPDTSGLRKTLSRFVSVKLAMINNVAFELT